MEWFYLCQAWNYSVWVRGYALYLEERVECFNALKYDVDKDQSRNRRLNTPDLLDQLPVLQVLLHHLLNCKPAGAAFYNHLIHYVLSITAGECVKLYIAITDGILNLINKYFEMQHHHAVKTLKIYHKAEEQLPESFLIAMEEYVKETPEITKYEGAAPTKIPAPVSDLLTDDVQEKSVTSSEKPGCFDEPSKEGTEPNENNPLALAIVKSENPPYAENVGSSAPAFTGRELGLCDAPVSIGAAVADNKMGPFYGSSSIPPEANVQTAAMPQQLPYIMPQQPPMIMVAYHSISPSAVANYNQIPTFYGGSNFTLSTDTKMAVIAPQQTDLKQQPTLAMVGYNSTKPSALFLSQAASNNLLPEISARSQVVTDCGLPLRALSD
ncbi:hypothetical protein J1N35_040821 [Gossypium stocksii]|uniref:ENTH domain-containing protein n=1 Tax=Gossypium stocksii TaxID=47602 RepID=A0A9D3UEU2_9ROSI|nr:hypothetical protein J1N35_040821 [Gossypium stocksii]